MTRVRFFSFMVGTFALVALPMQVVHSQEPGSATPVELTGDVDQAGDLFTDDVAFADLGMSDISDDGSAMVLPDEFQDAAFDHYMDIKLLAQALDTVDGGLLTDVGLQLAEGERVLQRPHKTITSDQVLRLAARVAVEKGDRETLNRIKKAAEVLERPELAKHVKAVTELAGASRDGTQALSVQIDKTPAEAILLVKDYLAQIQRASLIGDLETLNGIVQSLEEDDDAWIKESGLTGEQVKYLLERAKEAASAVEENGSDSALSKLVGASRAPDDFVVKNMTNNILRIDVVRVSKQYHAVWRAGWVTLRPGESKRFVGKGIEPEARIYLTVRNRDTGKLWTDNEDWTSKRIFARPAVVYTKRSGAPRGGEYFIRRNRYVAKQVFFGDWTGLKRFQRNLTRYPTSTRISTNNRSWIGVSIKIYGNYRFVGNSWGRD